MAAKKYEHPLGFLGTGAMARTFLSGLETLDGWLGPVYSPSRRATPRIVTALGSGFPVTKLEDMRRCQKILVCASPEDTAAMLEEALREEVLHKVDTLALVEASGSYLPAPGIASAVKEIGFLSKLPIRQHPTYLVEGSLRFRRFSQLLTGAPLRRLIFTRREARAMVDSAVFMAEEFCQPLFEAVQNCVMLAGVAPDHARQIAAELLAESVANANFAGRKRWTGILQTEDSGRFSRILEALQQENELLANLVYNYAQHGLAAMGRDTSWLRYAGIQPLRKEGRAADD